MADEIETIIRYDGPALAGHEMDIEELAPALLALASLIQTANHKFNGDLSAVRVTVNADVKQQCFQIKIKVIQDIVQMARSFLDGDMATIKEICEWIGLVGCGGLTLFKLLVKLGKTPGDTTTFSAEASGDATVIQAQSLEQHVHFHLPEGTPDQVKKLLEDPAIVSKAKQVLKPATQAGYETAGFYEPSGREIFSASKEEAKAVIALPSLGPAVEVPTEQEDGDEEHTPIKARVFVKTQQNEGNAQWGLKWAGRVEQASIDDHEWLTRFQTGKVPVTLPFYLDVEMDMVTSRTNPDAPARFHVLKVVDDSIPTGGGVQGDLLNDNSQEGA